MTFATEKSETSTTLTGNRNTRLMGSSSQMGGLPSNSEVCRRALRAGSPYAGFIPSFRHSTRREALHCTFGRLGLRDVETKDE